MTNPRPWHPAARLALASMLATVLAWLSPLANLEHGAGLRVLYGLRGAVPPPQEVLIVALDAASANALGLPERPDRWPRSLHARLVDGLADNGATVIGFDLLFQQARETADDLAFARALTRAGNVVLAEAVTREVVRAADGRVLATTDRRIRPLPLFADAALATAPFVLPKTPDGVFEFWSTVPALGDRPSLPLVMADHLARGEPGARATAGREARRSLNLYGPLGTVRTLSYARALELVADPAAGAAVFGGRAVLVGHSESNQSKQADVYRTPFSTADGVDLSGVELCATALGNLLEDAWLRRPGEAVVVGGLALYAGLLALPWGLARPRTALLATLGLALAYAALAHFAFSHSFLWLPVMVPLFFAPAIGAALGISSRYRELQQRRSELEKAVELGLSRHAIDRITEMLGGISGGKTVFAICLCSDVESYTSMSETLRPEQTRDLLNRYFARYLPIVERHGGYACDMIGDAVMSLWIADADDDAAFRQACGAALELDRAMNTGEADGALPTRFGLHCGPVFFGEIGAAGHHEIRAVGDIVNTASRIEGVNKYLHTRVLASSEVAVHLDAAAARDLGRFVLVGKARALALRQLLHEPLPGTLAQSFALGLAAFQGGDFDTGASHFAAARAAGDVGPAAFYLDHCRRLAEHPTAPDWQGAVTLAAK